MNKTILGIEKYTQENGEKSYTRLRIHYMEELSPLTAEQQERDKTAFREGCSVGTVTCNWVEGLADLHVGQVIGDFAYSRIQYWDKKENKMKDYYPVVGILPAVSTKAVKE